MIKGRSTLSPLKHCSSVCSWLDGRYFHCIIWLSMIHYHSMWKFFPPFCCCNTLLHFYYNFISPLAFWAEWLASLRHLSLKATNFAKPIIISDRKLNSKKFCSVWISFRFNHFLAIWLAVSLKQLTYSVSLHNCIYHSYAVRVAVHKSSSSVKSTVGWNRHPVPAYSLLLCYS